MARMRGSVSGDWELTSFTVAINEKLRGSKEFDLKTLDECAATHVAAAFDPRIDGM